ncbi:MAG: hypothetical protein ACRED5_05295 [Propylenella sp.]
MKKNVHQLIIMLSGVALLAVGSALLWRQDPSAKGVADASFLGIVSDHPGLVVIFFGSVLLAVGYLRVSPFFTRDISN